MRPLLLKIEKKNTPNIWKRPIFLLKPFRWSIKKYEVNNFMHSNAICYRSSYSKRFLKLKKINSLLSSCCYIFQTRKMISKISAMLDFYPWPALHRRTYVFVPCQVHLYRHGYFIIIPIGYTRNHHHQAILL